MTSSSHKSRENLLSSRAFCRSEPILSDSSTKRKTGLRGCICGGDGATDCSKDPMVITMQNEEYLLKRSLILYGIGHILVFGAFSALQTLQSSLFLETKLGVIAFTTIFFCAIFSGFYGPAFVQKFTPNWTAVLSSVVIALFLSAFFYPRLYTLIPPAILLGLVMGPLFSAQMSFLMTLVSRVSYVTEGSREKIQRKHLNLFFFFCNFSRIWGHLIVAMLIRYGGDIYIYFTQPELSIHHRFPPNVNPKYAMTGDIDMIPSPYAAVARPSLCSSDKISDDGIFRSATSYVFILPLNLTLMLVSVLLGMAFLGVSILITLLERCELYQNTHNIQKLPFMKKMGKVASALIDPYFRCMVLLIIFMGLEHGFICADFTRSYVSCALDLETVAYTMMAMAIANTIASTLIYSFLKYIRAIIIMAVGIICQAGLLMVLWLWTPVKDDVGILYIIAIGWGLCHAVWETILTSHMTSLYFEDWQAPFAAYFITQCVGLAASFGWSTLFVTEIKIYILIITLTFSSVSYVILEFQLQQKRKEQERVVQL